MGKIKVIKKTEEEILKETEEQKQVFLKKQEKKIKKVKIKEGKIFILCTYNNTIISLTDLQGNVLSQSSAGAIGFKGTKKGTAYAGSRVAAAIAFETKKLGLETIHVFIKGVGNSRDMSLKSLAANGLNIVSVEDITPIPYNGCRPRKRRRV